MAVNESFEQQEINELRKIIEDLKKEIYLLKIDLHNHKNSYRPHKEARF